MAKNNFRRPNFVDHVIVDKKERVVARIRVKPRLARAIHRVHGGVPSKGDEVAMPVPTHDATCKTKAFPITCKFCNASIFYFCCSHGSEVLFDQLGPPWPRHFANCVGHRIMSVQNSSNLSVAEVEDLVRADAKSRGTIVPENVQSIFRSLKYEETRVPTILPLTPGVDDKEFTGTLQDVNPVVNVLKQLDVTDTPIARGLLKDMLREPHGRIIVRGPVNARNGLCPQVEAFIPKSMLDRSKLAKFSRVTVVIRPKVLASATRFWVVKKIAFTQ